MTIPDQPAPPAYDAFVSAALADAPWVESWLLPRLESAGLRIATADDFTIGVSRLVNIERMTDASRHTLCVITPAWLNSDWQQFEALLTQSADPAGMAARLLPLLRENCALPRRLAHLEPANFTGPAERWESQLRRVIKALGATPPPAATPPASLPAAPQQVAPAASADDIGGQQERLRSERARLGDLLLQEAKFGSAWAPPSVPGGIRETRASIARIKQTLRGWGVFVADHPDDTR